MTRRNLLMLALSLSMVLSAPAAVSAAGASEKPSGHGVIATYHGQAIDLSKGWSGARICEVWTKADVRCYASQAEMRAAHAKILAASGWKGPYQPRDLKGCPGGITKFEWVCLYEFRNFGGRRLQFKDPDYWQNLNTYGFVDQASSWAKTRNPGFKLLDYRSSGNIQYVFGICGAASAASMPSGWDNIANAIWVYRQYPC
jgi:hypothetical protein